MEEKVLRKLPRTKKQSGGEMWRGRVLGTYAKLKSELRREKYLDFLRGRDEGSVGLERWSQ